jgi:pimeloyl-ACP methyl ester carboxylesterase
MHFGNVYRLFAGSGAHGSAVLLFLGAVLLLVPFICHSQADYAREHRWAEEIAPAIVVGEPVHLSLRSGRRFLAIYAPNPKATIGVIVVHGMGVHPDWGLINPLRSGLAEGGYSTLAVQMPVLGADARGDQYPPLFPEAAERLAVAVEFLRGRGLAKIAVVSHSMGARMTNYYLNATPNHGIAAWVAIGLPGAYMEPATIGIPVLDLYAERDLPALLEAVKQRAAALRGQRGSAQIEVPGADHFFAGQESALVRHVKQFLDARVR